MNSINIFTSAASHTQSNYSTPANRVISSASNPHNPILHTISICRFDGNSISMANKTNFPEVCSNIDCINEYNSVCKKKLRCGHDCLGINNQECLPCLSSQCVDFKNIYDQNSRSVCPICLTDDLKSYSCVIFKCMHIIHKRCLVKRLHISKNIIKKEINFNHIRCVICNYMYSQHSDQELDHLIKDELKIYNKIQLIISMKLEDDKMLFRSENENINEKSRNHIANDKFSFYLCEKCDSPFYCGLKECNDSISNNNEDDSLGSEKKLCLDCFDYTKIKGITNCDKHGRKHIQYKCKFCCEVSSHFCFGTTHFCEECHAKQLKGGYLTKICKEELPVCLGKDFCPLKLDHPSNGEEFGICCLLCISNNNK